MNKTVELLHTETAFDGFFRLERIKLRHSLYAGGLSQPLIRERLISADVAALLPYDPRLDEVVLIEQFRIGALERGPAAWLLEIVAGRIERGEKADDVAARECCEETGCTVERLLAIGRFFTSPHRSNEVTHLYCGIVDATAAQAHAGLLCEGEDIRVRRFAAEDALALLRDGSIDSAWPLIAVQWLALNRDALRRSRPTG
jgi:ADP-ribose pyrophosphatase